MFFQLCKNRISKNKKQKKHQNKVKGGGLLLGRFDFQIPQKDAFLDFLAKGDFFPQNLKFGTWVWSLFGGYIRGQIGWKNQKLQEEERQEKVE